MKLAILSDVSAQFFISDFQRNGFEMYTPGGFNTWYQEILDTNSELYSFSPDAIAIILKKHIDLPNLFIEYCKQNHIKLICPNISVLSNEVPGFFDLRMEQIAGMPFSLKGIKAIEEEIQFQLNSRPLKIIATDADETLWSGIISEGDTPIPKLEYQKGLLELKNRGVLLVLLSKNEETDVNKTFAENPMPLKNEDFVENCVNWSSKSENLQKICKSLNLPTSSVLFIDDNPAERAEMLCSNLNVEVLPPPAIGCETQFFRRLNENFFPASPLTKEDKLRTEMYHAEQKRKIAAASAPSLHDYLTNLELRAIIRKPTDADLDRMIQLAQRTNQFNATTRRLSKNDFNSLINDKSKLVQIVESKDCFGDNGIVGIVIADLISRKITDFMMSCRVMSRTLEDFILNNIINKFKMLNLKLSGIEFIESDRNAPFKKWLDNIKRIETRKTYYQDVHNINEGK